MVEEIEEVRKEDIETYRELLGIEDEALNHYIKSYASEVGGKTLFLNKLANRRKELNV